MIHKVITKKYMPGNPIFAGRLVHPSPHIKIHPLSYSVAAGQPQSTCFKRFCWCHSEMWKVPDMSQACRPAYGPAWPVGNTVGYWGGLEMVIRLPLNLLLAKTLSPCLNPRTSTEAEESDNLALAPHSRSLRFAHNHSD